MQQENPLYKNRGLTTNLPGLSTANGQICGIKPQFFSFLQAQLAGRVSLSRQRGGGYTWTGQTGSAKDLSRDAVGMLLLQEVKRVFGVDLSGFFIQFVRCVDAFAAAEEIANRMTYSEIQVFLKANLSPSNGTTLEHAEIRDLVPETLRGQFDQCAATEIWNLFHVKQRRVGKARRRVYENLSLAAPACMSGAESSTASGQALHPFFKKSPLTGE